MANLKAGKHSFLPPKSPFPTVPPSYGDFGAVGPKGAPRPREGQRHHQRTSSESFLIEEQPSWLDDLLDEPEAPARRPAHRRSSSDSFAYLDPGSGFDPASYYAEAASFGRQQQQQQQNRVWESALNVVGYPSSLPPAKEKNGHLGSSFTAREIDGLAVTTVERQALEECSQDPIGPSDWKEGSQGKQAQSETDTKRVKQQFAQRSRVRKLQYIAELERHVQALQADGLEVSAELEFMDQQNLILNLENNALKQRLDSLAQEQLIKRVQQETLEREIARLKLLCQQQLQQQQLQQQQPPVSSHRRSNSRDLDSQFANLSLKNKEANSARDPFNGPLHI